MRVEKQRRCSLDNDANGGSVGCIGVLIGHLILLADVRSWLRSLWEKTPKFRMEMEDGGLAKKQPWRMENRQGC